MIRSLRYRFDNLMSRGPAALILWLAVVCFLVAIVATASFVLLRLGPAGSDNGVVETFWRSLMQLIHPESVKAGDGSWGFVLVTFLVSLGGILVASTLIGLLTTAISDRIENLRKGRSTVIEEGHTVILGWSVTVVSIVTNLIEANANLKSGCIVILSKRPKVEVEDELRERIPKRGNTRIVVRSGETTSPSDVLMTSPATARSIILVSTEGDDPDARTIRSLLALSRVVGSWQGKGVVVQVREERNIEVLRMIAPDTIRTVHAGDLISRIMVQAGRQSGLSEIYAEMLDFADNEIYFHDDSDLAGHTFRELAFGYDRGMPIGIRRRSGAIELRPPQEARLEVGDSAIVIALDDDREAIRFIPNRKCLAEEECIVPPVHRAPRAERTLFLGWNNHVPGMLRELFTYVTPESTATVVAPDGVINGEVKEIGEAPFGDRVTFATGPITTRNALLDIGIDQYDHVVVVPCCDNRTSSDADSETLVTLLHLRRIADETGARFSIVTEMLDARNRELAEIANPDDFVIDERLISLMLSQVAESPELETVFAELFSAEGSEIYVRPLTDYVAPGPTSWDTIIESSLRREEVAFGIRKARHSRDGSKRYGVLLNPDRDEAIEVEAGDMVIVLGDE